MAAPDAEFAALVRSFREHAPPAPELAWTLPPEWGAADLEAPYWREAHASGIFELEMVSSLVSFRRCTSYCSLRHMMAGDGERVAQPPTYDGRRWRASCCESCSSRTSTCDPAASSAGPRATGTSCGRLHGWRCASSQVALDPWRTCAYACARAFRVLRVRWPEPLCPLANRPRLLRPRVRRIG